MINKPTKGQKIFCIAWSDEYPEAIEATILAIHGGGWLTIVGIDGEKKAKIRNGDKWHDTVTAAIQREIEMCVYRTRRINNFQRDIDREILKIFGLVDHACEWARLIGSVEGFTDALKGK